MRDFLEAPPGDETYGAWVESDNSDRSSCYVENDDSKRRQEPRSVFVVFGADGGRTKLVAQEMSELQIRRAGRWKSRAFMVYVRDAGEGAQKVSAALTREG